MKIHKGKEGAKMTITTISLPAELYRKLKHLAVDQDEPTRNLIRQAIEEFLARSEKGDGPK